MSCTEIWSVVVDASGFNRPTLPSIRRIVLEYHFFPPWLVGMASRFSPLAMALRLDPLSNSRITRSITRSGISLVLPTVHPKTRHKLLPPVQGKALLNVDVLDGEPLVPAGLITDDPEPLRPVLPGLHGPAGAEVRR